MQLFNTSLAMRIIHNMGYQNKAISVLMQQLSSGNRLVNASIDPAGLAISRKMEAQIRGLNQASRNAQDAISLIQTAEGALSGISDMLNRIKELTVQAANDSNTDSDRQKIQAEINELIKEINATAERTEFNKKKLLNGSCSQDNRGLYFQTGANAGQGMTAYINRIDAETLNLANFDFTGKTGEEISAMVGLVDSAIDKVASERSRLGAYENRLGYTISNLENMAENLSAANSRITDMDMAKGLMQLARQQLLQQVSMTVLQMMFQHQRMMVELLLRPLYYRPYWRYYY